MGMSRCYSLMKCLLILFNIIFLLVGVGACGAAGWALWDGRAGETPQGRAALCALAAWAAALALGALAALAGATRHSPSLLAAAFALLALTLVAEGAAAWWGGAHLPQLRRALTDRLHHTVERDYGALPARTHVLDAIQQGLECCGAESTRDWQNSVWAHAVASADPPSPTNTHTHTDTDTLDLSVGAPSAYYWVPASCCSTVDPMECEVSRRVAAASNGARGLHPAPCAPRLIHALETGARVPLAIGGALLVMHAITLLLALALCLRAHPDTRQIWQFVPRNKEN